MEELIGEFIIAVLGIIAYVIKHYYDKRKTEEVQDRVDLMVDKNQVLIQQNRDLGNKLRITEKNFEEGKEAYKSLHQMYDTLKEESEKKPATRRRTSKAKTAATTDGEKKAPAKRGRKPRAKK